MELKGFESLCLLDITKMGIFDVHYHPSLFTRVHWIIYFLPCLTVADNIFQHSPVLIGEQVDITGYHSIATAEPLELYL